MLLMKNHFKGMKKPLIIMLVFLGILFGAIFIYKGIMAFFIKQYFASHKNPTMYVSTIKASYATWQTEINAVGSTRATLGVNVTAQIAGMIQTIYFTPGAVVEKGTLLVQQNADPNIGLLHALEATAELDRITYERDKKQYKVKAVSKQQLDTDYQNLQNALVQVEEQKATVAQLTITAPFTGRLGISQVNPGQFLNPGDTVTTLQSLDPIYVDFYLPQRNLASIKVGQSVTITVDTFSGQVFNGKITTINPIVDSSIRNVEVEATLSNPKNQLLPGMFTNVSVMVDKTNRYLTLPQTAISFNSYGDIAYIVKEGSKDKNGEPSHYVEQIFVTTGDTRGDQVVLLKGIKEGDEIVTSGQLKLKNNTPVIINNKVTPDNNPNPAVPNEH